MAVTLAEILALPIMAPARLITGADRLHTPVRGVHVTEVPRTWRQAPPSGACP